jgi:hypothetical protein
MMFQVVEGWDGIDPSVLPCSTAELGFLKRFGKEIIP